MSLAKKRCKVFKGHFRNVPVKTNANGSMDLVLPDIPEHELREQLPPVSIVTITKDRGMFAGNMLYNWINIKYPRDKLEWVILDDSEDRSVYDLEDYLPPEDPYIKYHKLDRWYPVAEKRNKAVELASYEYIVHMDDDDYYFPDHVIAKIRIMLHYGCQGVHSLPVGVYDMMERTSYIFSTDTSNYDTNNVAEATFAYTKDYWRNNKFYSNIAKGMGEGLAFINNKFKKWMNLHFMFNMISITHARNITGHQRRLIVEGNLNTEVGNFEDMFPEGFKFNLDNVRRILSVDYVQPEAE